MKRETNIELLRVVAMLFIIAHHYALHGGVYYATSTNIFSATFLVALGKLGVNLFVLITGYFMIHSQFKIMRLIRLELAVLFYSILWFIAAVFCLKTAEISFLSLRNSLFPTLINNGSYYWFIPCYMGLLFLSPFINRLVSSLSKKQFQTLLLILFVGISVLPTFLYSAAWYDGNMFLFLLLYLMGGYIRKYDVRLDRIPNVILLLLNVVIYVWIVCIIIFVRRNTAEAAAFGVWPERIWEGASFFIILLSFFVFMFFKQIKVRHSSIINRISSATIGVYLFHDNLYARQYIWVNFFHTDRYVNSEGMIYHALFCIVMVFALGTLIELIRVWLFQPVVKGIANKKIMEKLDGYMDMKSGESSI